MLNKLSYNLMNALNESEEIEVKKTAYTENTYLNENCKEELKEDEEIKLKKATITNILKKAGYKLGKLYWFKDMAFYGECEKPDVKDGDFAIETVDNDGRFFIYANRESFAENKMVKLLKENGINAKIYSGTFSYIEVNGYEESSMLEEDIDSDEEKESIEERLASLKTQLEVDGEQLADDEKEAIKAEIAELENKLDTDEVDNKIMNESAPGTDAYDKLVSGDDVFFRDESGVALLGHYADSYPEPEEYDEGFKIENGGTEEELQKAKEAANNRDVWEFLEVDESTCQPNGTIIAYIYGQDELMEYLKQLRQVEVIKKLEEDQIEDARKDSVEKGLVSEEEEPEPRKLTREEWNKEFGPGADPDVINAGREPQDRVEIIDESENKSEITEEVKTSVEEAITKVLTDVYDKYGAKSGDITPEQSLKLEDLEEKISSLILELYNQNSDSIEESAKVLKENADDLAMLIEKTFGNSKLMYKFDGNFVSAEDFCYDFETTDFESSEELLNFLENYYNAENTWKLDDKKYEEIVNRIKAGEWELEESEETPIAEAEVKGLKEVKNQGNIYMLEDETNKFIVGENYNADEGLIEKAEIYDNKEEADKDYLGRCEITGGEQEVVEEGVITDLKLKSNAKKVAKAINTYQNDKTPENKAKADKAISKNDELVRKITTKSNKAYEKANEKARKIKDKAYEKEQKVQDKISKQNRDIVNNVEYKK